MEYEAAKKELSYLRALLSPLPQLPPPPHAIHADRIDCSKRCARRQKQDRIPRVVLRRSLTAKRSAHTLIVRVLATPPVSAGKGVGRVLEGRIPPSRSSPRALSQGTCFIC